MKRSHVGIGAALLAAIAVLIYVLAAGGDDGKGSADAKRAGKSAENGSLGQAMPPPLAPQRLPARSELPAAARGTVGGPAVPGAQHDPRAAALRYAPTSRPMTYDDVAHLDPLGGEVDEGVANPRADDGSRYSYAFRADRRWVTGSDPVTLTLVVREGDNPNAGKPVAANILGGSIREVGTGGEEREVGALTLADAGASGDAEAGDFTYSASLVPADEPAYRDATGYYRAYVSFQVAERAPVETRVLFHYTAKREVPARFTGAVDDRVESGNLVVGVGLDVREPGTYRIAANLYDAGGRPLGRAHDRRPYQSKGKVTVNLVFQGLIFHDMGRPGPYLVRFIHGYRETGVGNGREAFPSLDKDHKTDDYAIEQFSSKSWKTP